MESPIVFAMSPRVGRWNHRYFTPTGSRLTEKEAARLVGDALDPARPDPAIVHAQTPVRQSSTGRVNPEALLVRDPRLSRCSNEVRERIEKILAERLPEFGRFIVGLTDEETESEMLIRHKGFDELSRAVRRELAPVLATLPPAAAPERREPEPAPRAAGTFRRFSPYVLLGIVALAVALPVIQSTVFLQRGKPAPSKEDTNFKEFYIAILGMERDRTEVGREFDDMSPEDRIAKIRDRLLEGYSEKPLVSNGTGVSRSSPAEELRPLLKEYYTAKYGIANPPPDILAEAGFREAMQKAFKNEDINLAAFLEPETPGKSETAGIDALKQFKCTGPSHFHDVFDAFVELQWATKDAQDWSYPGKLDGFWQRDFIRHFPEETPLSAATPPKYTLRLYTKEDAGRAEAVITLLKGFKGVPSSIKDVEGPTPVGWLHDKLSKSQNEWESDELKIAIKDKKYGDAFQALKALGVAWLSKEGTGHASSTSSVSP